MSDFWDEKIITRSGYIEIACQSCGSKLPWSLHVKYINFMAFCSEQCAEKHKKLKIAQPEKLNAAADESRPTGGK